MATRFRRLIFFHAANLFTLALSTVYFEYITSSATNEFTLLGADTIRSANLLWRLRMQDTDGNLVLYDDGVGDSVWSTATTGNKDAIAILESDGNFKVVSKNNKELYSTNSANGTINAPYYLYLHDEGYIYILNKYGIQTWTSDQNTQNMSLPASFSVYDPSLFEIWTDDMTAANKWKANGTEVSFAHSSAYCPNSVDKCMKLISDGINYAERPTNISAFSFIELKIDFTVREESGEEFNNNNCTISYKYDDDEWILYGSYHYNAVYTNRVIKFPKSPSSGVITIKLEVNSDDTKDSCHWQNLVLRGRNKTLSPSISPTIDPTIYPSTNPSLYPTQYPSINPTTDNPTNEPSENPTDEPSSRPSSLLSNSTSPTLQYKERNEIDKHIDPPEYNNIGSIVIAAVAILCCLILIPLIVCVIVLRKRNKKLVEATSTQTTSNETRTSDAKFYEKALTQSTDDVNIEELDEDEEYDGKHLKLPGAQLAVPQQKDQRIRYSEGPKFVPQNDDNNEQDEFIVESDNEATAGKGKQTGSHELIESDSEDYLDTDNVETIR